MKFYTGVGSRDVPDDIGNIITNIAKELARTGYRLRSGGADGCDSWFQMGAEIVGGLGTPRMDIYIAWNGFNDLQDNGKTVHAPTNWSNWKEAEEIAKQIHPAWDKCSRGAKALHTRNVYQVLGHNLDNPSKFLICYAQPQGNDNVKGGTRTAWEIARLYDVPRFNLYDEQDRERIGKWLHERKAQ